MLGAPVAASAQAPTFQGSLPARIVGPRSVAASPDGEMFVADGSGRLYRLTKRGAIVGQVLDGVVSVAASQGVVLAATRSGKVVTLDPKTGRALREVTLGTHEAPVALAVDAARGKLWVAYASGVLQGHALDGARLHYVPPASGVSRVAGLAVDASGTVWLAQDRTAAGATLHAFNGDTAAPIRSAPVSGLKVVGGLAAGSAGGLYVSDLFSGRVQQLKADATPGALVGAPGTGSGQLAEPAGVAVIPNGDVVVANMDANRLDRFGTGAALPGCPGDADCDGLPDDWEIANGLDPNDPSDAFADPDHDGLNNSEEYALGTNPRKADTDGDGYADGVEVASGFDPNDPNDHRPQVAVNGPASSDPGQVRLSSTVRDPVGDRGACAVRWSQVGGAPVLLKGATTSAPTFVARAAGAYAFEAVGSCGAATSVPARVEVAVKDVAPRAEGGRLVTLPVGGSLLLSGQFSSDANGDALVYQWDQLVGPPAVGGVAGDALSAELQTPGFYVFRLGAVDAAGNEGAAEVPVLVLGDQPVATAVAVSPVRAHVGDVVALDASGSYRSAAATFSWQQVDGPAVALDGAAGAQASFVAAEAARYVFEVAVQEGAQRSPPARVEVFAAAAGTELPVARAAAPATAATDVPVTLDGTTSTGTGGLTYAWRQVSGPAAGLTRGDRAAATVVLFAPGAYEFELVVSDLAGASVPSRVRLSGRARNAPIPVAAATAPATAVAGDLVLLDGRASTGAMRHRWTQVDGPWVTVEQGAVGSFVPAVPGVYGFELEVDDGAVRSAPARVTVVVSQNGTGN